MYSNTPVLEYTGVCFTSRQRQLAIVFPPLPQPSGTADTTAEQNLVHHKILKTACQYCRCRKYDYAGGREINAHIEWKLQQCNVPAALNEHFKRKDKHRKQTVGTSPPKNAGITFTTGQNCIPPCRHHPI